MKIYLIIIFSFYFFMITPSFGEPATRDPQLIVEEFVTGLSFPTKFDFIENDILVLQKNDGQVRLIKDGILQKDPVLEINVENRGESGLLGIAVVNSTIYLYFTEITPNSEVPFVNRIYKYQWNGEELVKPILVNEFPANVRLFEHQGGAMIADSKGNVYVVIGDTDRGGIMQNVPDGKLEDVGIIMRVSEGNSEIQSISSTFERYVAMGIRNSFGLAIDPMTGNIWDSENGPLLFDEINLVEPKFNSGWNVIMGPAVEENLHSLTLQDEFVYSDPEFSWELPIAPTGLAFANSKSFEKYKDTLFVGDFNQGTISKFKLNSERTGFVFETPELSDLVANRGDPIQETIFATGFEPIIDLKFGPEGALYVVSVKNGGTMYRIFPSEQNQELSPKQQLKTGVLPENISCKKGFVFVVKSSNDDISCVSPRTGAILLERGWGENSKKLDIDKCQNPPGPNVDWSGCTYLFVNLSGINLSGANLENANLVGSNLSNTNLSGADLTKTDLTFAILKNADVSNTKAVWAQLTKADLSYSKWDNTDLRSAQIQHANLENIVITNSDLTSTYLSHSNLKGADLSGTNLRSAQLYNTNLSEANLSGANLLDSILTLANLSNSNLENTQLNEKDITDSTILEGCKNHNLC